MRLPAVDQADLDVAVAALDAGAQGLGEPSGRIDAADHGDDLATTAEQPRHHVDRDFLEVGAHDDDVSGDRTQDVAGLAGIVGVVEGEKETASSASPPPPRFRWC